MRLPHWPVTLACTFTAVALVHSGDKSSADSHLPTEQSPSAWLETKIGEWVVAGCTVDENYFHDVVEASCLRDTETRSEFYKRLQDDEENTWARDKWERKAYLGSTHGVPAYAENRIRMGAFFYDGKLSDIAAENGTTYAVEFEKILSEFTGLGMDTMYYQTAFNREGSLQAHWDLVDSLANAYDVDVVVSYPHGMHPRELRDLLDPATGRWICDQDTFEERLSKANAFLDHAENASVRLLAYALREELKPEFLSNPTCDYFADDFARALRDGYSSADVTYGAHGIPFYTTYNNLDTMKETEFLSEYAGIDRYTFKGGYFPSKRLVENYYWWPIFSKPSESLGSLDGQIRRDVDLIAKRNGLLSLTTAFRGTAKLFHSSLNEDTCAVTQGKPNPPRVTPLGGGTTKSSAVPIDYDNPGVKHFGDDGLGTTHFASGCTLAYRRYAPPPYAIHAMVWLGMAHGAKWFVPWYYRPRLPWAVAPVFSDPEHWSTFDQEKLRDAVTGAYLKSKDLPQWQAYADAIADVREHEDLLAALHPDGTPRFVGAVRYDGRADHDLLGAAQDFNDPAIGGNIVILVDVYDGLPKPDGPGGDNPWGPFVLDVTNDGSLTYNNEPFSIRHRTRTVTFDMRIRPGEALYDVARGVRLTPINGPPSLSEPRRYVHKFETGKGAFFFVGTEEEWGAVHDAFHVRKPVGPSDQRIVASVVEPLSNRRIGVGRAPDGYPYFGGDANAILQFTNLPPIDPEDVGKAELAIDVHFASAPPIPVQAERLEYSGPLDPDLAWGDYPIAVPHSRSATTTVTGAGSVTIDVTEAVKAQPFADGMNIRLYAPEVLGNRFFWWSARTVPKLEIDELVDGGEAIAQACIDDDERIAGKWRGVGRASSTYPYFQGDTSSYVELARPLGLSDARIAQALLTIDVKFLAGGPFSAIASLVEASGMDAMDIDSIDIDSELRVIDGTDSPPVVVSGPGRWTFDITDALLAATPGSRFVMKIHAPEVSGSRWFWWSHTNKPQLGIRLN